MFQELTIKIEDLERVERANQLAELLPRNKCRNYAGRREVCLVTKQRFDELFKTGEFSDGPFKDNFGEGYGEPYNPNRQAFGKLKDGRIIYCELSPEMQEKAKSYLESLLIKKNL